jgi:hypothetical protein
MFEIKGRSSFQEKPEILSEKRKMGRQLRSNENTIK